MKRAMKIAGGGFAIALFAVGVLILDRYGMAYRSVADWSGDMVLAGLTAPADIVRDANGVPHIHGTSEEDVSFALGVAHAQDRLWQMELFRRVGQGRLAEIMGPLALPADRYLRTLGLYAYAEQSLEHLSPETRGVLDAYASGVNAYLETNAKPLPLEFQFLAHEPEPWRPADSVVMIKLLALGLSSTGFRELSYASLARDLESDRLAAFFPPYPGDAPAALKDLAELYRAAPVRETAAAIPNTGPLPASNNWVVSGERTQSGKPLLANDPHLGMLAPSIWYLAHLAYPDRSVVGATIAGVPSVILGRNDWIAWGYTNTGADVQDIYVEKINPENPDQYLTPDGWRAFETRTEIIKVRFAKDERLTVRSTRHGPVLPDGASLTNGAVAEGHVLSVAWPALTARDRTIEAGHNMTRARNWQDFNAALEHYVAPMQNMVYADVAGDIGFVAPARVPIRKPEHDTGGRAPAPGWKAANDWTGFIPFGELPRTHNPSNGAIVTANNKIVPDSYPYAIATQWDLPYRALRIRTLLASRPAHDVASFAAMQMDNRSDFAAEFLPLLLTTKPADAKSAAALEKLAAWDADMASDSPAPLIFAAWFRALARAVYADELGDHFSAHWSFKPLFMKQVLTDGGGAGGWCDDISTEKRTETCADMLALSLSEAVADLGDAYGPEMGAWAWQDAHPVLNRHIPAGFLPLVGGAFTIEHPSAGGTYTVNRGQHSFSSDRPFANIHAAGYRAVYDLADPDASLYMISTGQSGNPLSPFYGNLTEPWANGDYVQIKTRRADVDPDALGILRLLPKE